MTTTIHKKDMILHEGDIYVIMPNSEIKTGIYYRSMDAYPHQPISYSTKYFTDVNQLNRNHFVKPKICNDIEESPEWQAANDWVFDKNGNKWSNNDNSAGDNFGSFLAGVNYANKANKAEFTMEEITEAINLAYIHGQQNVVSKDFARNSIIEMLRPLSIPECIVIDNDEIVEVKW